jgi:hypothetical protein
MLSWSRGKFTLASFLSSSADFDTRPAPAAGAMFEATASLDIAIASTVS